MLVQYASKKMNGSNGTSEILVTVMLRSSTSVTRELLESNLNVTSALHDCSLHQCSARLRSGLPVSVGVSLTQRV